MVASSPDPFNVAGVDLGSGISCLRPLVRLLPEPAKKLLESIDSVARGVPSSDIGPREAREKCSYGIILDMGDM